MQVFAENYSLKQASETYVFKEGTGLTEGYIVFLWHACKLLLMLIRFVHGGRNPGVLKWCTICKQNTSNLTSAVEVTVTRGSAWFGL